MSPKDPGGVAPPCRISVPILLVVASSPAASATSARLAGIYETEPGRVLEYFADAIRISVIGIQLNAFDSSEIEVRPLNFLQIRRELAEVG